MTDNNPQNWKWRIAKAGLTMSAFAAKAKVSNSNLSLYCAGKKNPRELTIIKIEKTLKKLKV